MNRKKALKVTSEALSEFIMERDAVIDILLVKGIKWI